MVSVTVMVRAMVSVTVMVRAMVIVTVTILVIESKTFGRI